MTTYKIHNADGWLLAEVLGLEEAKHWVETHNIRSDIVFREHLPLTYLTIVATDLYETDKFLGWIMKTNQEVKSKSETA